MHRNPWITWKQVSQRQHKNAFQSRKWYDTANKKTHLDDKALRKHSAWIRYLNHLDGQAYQEYIRGRNEAQHALWKARRKFKKSLAKPQGLQTQAVWSYVNSRRARSTIAQLVKSDGSLTQSDQEIAEVLGDQYYKTFTREELHNIPEIADKKLSTPPLLKFTVTKEQVYKHPTQK